MHDARSSFRYLAPWAVGLAFFIAPVLVAALIALINPNYPSFPRYAGRAWQIFKDYLFFITVPIAWIFGAPVYIILYKFLPPRPINFAAMGVVAAAALWLLWELWSPSVPNTTFDGKAIVIDGVRTSWGWYVAAESMLLAIGAGALAGLLFWAIATSFHKLGKSR